MKKIVLILMALTMALSLMLCACAPVTEVDDAAGSTASTGGEQTEEKSFTVIVVHKDGTEKTFNYTTKSKENLGPVLVAEGLIVESESAGMYNTVDGVTADWNVDQTYWAFYVGDEMAMFGMNDAEIHDGDTFKLVHTS